MDSHTLDLIFDSKLLNPREKWLIVRVIKQGLLSESQVQAVLDRLSEEDDLIESVKHQKQEAYLKALEDWHEALDALYHQKIVKGRAQASIAQSQEDQQEAERILNQL